MKSKIFSLAHSWLPPIIIRYLKRLLAYGRSGVRFEGPYASWEEAKRYSSGYENEQILDKVLASTLKVKHGEAAYERDSVLFDEIQYSWPVTAGLMWVAAKSGGRLSVLDFGGSLGSSYFQNRKFLDSLMSIRWSIVEQSHFVVAGRRNIQDKTLKFYETIEECLKYEKPNIVLVSSVLQYLENPFGVLDALKNSGAHVIVVDKTPFTAMEHDKLTIQRVDSLVYPASYPMRIFSEPSFLAEDMQGWLVHSTFMSPEGIIQSSSGTFYFKGFIFECINSEK